MVLELRVNQYRYCSLSMYIAIGEPSLTIVVALLSSFLSQQHAVQGQVQAQLGSCGGTVIVIWGMRDPDPSCLLHDCTRTVSIPRLKHRHLRRHTSPHLLFWSIDSQEQ
jgi:hypothetical protein